MRNMDDLHYFAAVARHGGFSAAARALRVAKSLVSKRVAALEDQLGVRLFERSTRRVRLTEIGQEVYLRAVAMIEKVDEIDAITTRVKIEPQGLVRVSCPANAAEVLRQALPELLHRYPLLRVQMIMSNRPVDLIADRIDVAIRVREHFDTDGDLQLRVVGTSRLVLVASPAWVEINGLPDTPSALSSLPTIARHEEEGPARWMLTGSEGREAFIELQPRFAIGDFGLLLDMVRRGLGIALLPDSLCAPAIAAGQLTHILPDWAANAGTVHLVFPSRRGLLPSVRAFIEYAVEALAASLRPGQA